MIANANAADELRVTESSATSMLPREKRSPRLNRQPLTSSVASFAVVPSHQRSTDIATRRRATAAAASSASAPPSANHPRAREITSREAAGSALAAFRVASLGPAALGSGSVGFSSISGVARDNNGSYPSSHDSLAPAVMSLGDGVRAEVVDGTNTSSTSRNARMGGGGAPAAKRHKQHGDALRSQNQRAAHGPTALPRPFAYAGARSVCGCRKSRCLNLYCACFAAEALCMGCRCQGCENHGAQPRGSRRDASEQRVSARASHPPLLPPPPQPTPPSFARFDGSVAALIDPAAALVALRNSSPKLTLRSMDDAQGVVEAWRREQSNQWLQNAHRLRASHHQGGLPGGVPHSSTISSGDASAVAGGRGAVPYVARRWSSGAGGIGELLGSSGNGLPSEWPSSSRLQQHRGRTSSAVVHRFDADPRIPAVNVAGAAYWAHGGPPPLPPPPPPPPPMPTVRYQVHSDGVQFTALDSDGATPHLHQSKSYVDAYDSAMRSMGYGNHASQRAPSGALGVSAPAAALRDRTTSPPPSPRMMPPPLLPSLPLPLPPPTASAMVAQPAPLHRETQPVAAMIAPLVRAERIAAQLRSATGMREPLVTELDNELAKVRALLEWRNSMSSALPEV